MNSFKRNGLLSSVMQILWNLFLIAIGSVLCAIAVNGILIPREFYGAGFTGIALVLHYLIPAMPIAGLYFVLNIPVYALGWMYVGRRFFFQHSWSTHFFGGLGLGAHTHTAA
jgi:uncharacterized membrane-anchored protein YitT (DUF2179 family)